MRTVQTRKELDARFFVRSHNLLSELDHRDPRSPIQDIETGACLKAVDELPQFRRMELEDNTTYEELGDLIAKRCLNQDCENSENIPSLQSFCPICKSDNLETVVLAHSVVLKVVRLRDPEFLQGNDPNEPSEDEPEISREDALSPGRGIQLSSLSSGAALLGDNEDEVMNEDEELLEDNDAGEQQAQRTEGGWIPPRAKWDLVYQHEAQVPKLDKKGKVMTEENGKVIMEQGFSAPIFPRHPWKGRITDPTQKTIFQKLERMILFRMELPAATYIYQESQKLSTKYRYRIWQIWRQTQILHLQRALQSCKSTIEAQRLEKALEQARSKPCNHRMGKGKKLPLEERLKLIHKRAEEIRIELRENVAYDKPMEAYTKAILNSQEESTEEEIF